MLTAFTFSFMIRALIAGLAVGFIAPIIGTFLVVRRYALLADTLSHVALVGVAVGLLIGINPLIGALAVCLVVSLGMEKIRRSHKLFSESVLALFLSGSLAVALIILALTHGMGTNIFSYLFGSISTVTGSDVLVVIVAAIVVTTVVGLLYKKFFIIAYDEEWATASGVPTGALNAIFMATAATTVAVSIQVVGALLVGALIVIPVLTAMQYANSFGQTIIYGVVFSLSSVLLGLIASFYLNLPSGPTIVVANLIFFGVSLLVAKKNT